MSDVEPQILFEPWNMGDALIAAAIAMQAPRRLTLACNSRWHSLIRAVAGDNECPELIAVDLEYVNRGRKGRTESGTLPNYPQKTKVVTIRGDVRDYLAARKIFSQSSVRASGWYSFAARRSALLDFPFGQRWMKIRNRYRAWASITGVPWPVIEAFYADKLSPSSQPVVTIHFGAQWRSKQYPHVAALAELLGKTTTVQLVGGPADPLPPDIEETEVQRLVNQDLVDAFRASSFVLANDSGPMHLAAILRCRVACISRMSSLAEWLPPATIPINSSSTPSGYRPDSNYQSDEQTSGWPAPPEVARRIRDGL